MTHQPYANGREIDEAVRVAEEKLHSDGVSSLDELQHGEEDGHYHAAGSRRGDDDNVCVGSRHGSQKGEQAPSNWLDTRRWPLYELRRSYREYLAEFWGTFVFVFFGLCGYGTSKVAGGKVENTYGQKNASYLLIACGWSFGYTIALYICIGISGGHLNPAITIARSLFGELSWRKVPGYIVSQILGAMLAGACMYGLYKYHIDGWEADLPKGRTMPQEAGHLFYTKSSVSHGYSVFTELISTMVYMMGVLGTFDRLMTPATGHLPVGLGLVMLIVCISSGYNTMYAMNPARDFGPRIIAAFIWGSEPFKEDGSYFLIPLFVPIIGASVGAFFYTYCIVPKSN